MTRLDESLKMKILQLLDKTDVDESADNLIKVPKNRKRNDDEADQLYNEYAAECSNNPDYETDPCST